MQLSLYSDYALRVMLFVGSNSERRITNTEIAAYYEISQEHLRKVIHQLGEGGYLKTFRGKGGGIELNAHPSKINIGRLLRFTESHSNIVDCASQPCVLSPVCSLKSALYKAESAFYETLEGFTLQDLIEVPAMQRTLITASPNIIGSDS